VLPGDWRGLRKSSKGYCLAHADENLTGPPTEQNEMMAAKLSNNQKGVMKQFCKYIVQTWPSQELNPDPAESHDAAFVDPTGFWYALFKTEFKRFVCFLMAQNEQNSSQNVRYSKILLVCMLNIVQLCKEFIYIGKLTFFNLDVFQRINCQLEDEIEGVDGSPFSLGLLVSIHTSCISILQDSTNTEIRTAVQKSQELGEKIKAAKRVGHKCAKRALWIPVIRCACSCLCPTYTKNVK
jgi:hypothetical protein